MYIVCVGSPKRSPTLFYAYAAFEFIEFIERKKYPGIVISRDILILAVVYLRWVFL